MHTHKILRYSTTQFRVVGNERRASMLVDFRERPYSVKELAQKYKIHQTSATQHVHRMRAANFVEGRRKGKYVSFRLTRRARRSKALWRALREGFF